VRAGWLLAVMAVGLIPWTGAAAGKQATKIALAAGGHTEYVIVIADHARVTHTHAAQELARFLGEITGADFPVMEEGQYRQSLTSPLSRGERGKPAIFVGLSAAARKAAPDATLRGLGHDGLVIRTVGDDLLLYGGEPRGTLYAVYTFLEDYLGCRWWTSTESTIPKRDTIILPALNDRQVPVLEYREPFFFDAFDGDWAVRNKANGASERLSAEQGGKITYQGFVHTLDQLAGPKEFFATHPEWFAMREGKRTSGYTQNCLTNEALKRHVAQRVLEWLRANPTVNIVSVSQNDNGDYCQCPQCTALDKKEGSHAGSLLHFVNYVARAVAKEFPNVAIDTLAYQYTRKPPKYVRPDPNVIVRLCSIECNFAQPLTHPSNKAFYNDLVGWNKICKRLYVWDYVTNFSHYLRPQPNVFVIGPNVKTFVAHGVKGLFEQGSYQSPGGDMAPLKAWVLAHMLWNPERDPNALIKEFLNGYYGAAGPYVGRYLDLLHRDVTGQNHYYGCFDDVQSSFPTYRTMKRAEALFRQAQAAVAGQPTLEKRLRMAHLALTYTWLHRVDLQVMAEAEGYAWCEGNDPANAGKAIALVCQENGITRVAESRPLDVTPYLTDYRKASKPAGYEQVKGLIDLQDYRFVLRQPVTHAVADPTASDGMTAVTPGKESEDCEVQTSIRFHPGNGIANRYRAFVVVKALLEPGATGTAFRIGLFHRAQDEDILVHDIKTEQVKSGEWQTWEYGVVDLRQFQRRGAHLWVAPQANPGVKSVAVDRFFLVPVDRPAAQSMESR